MTDCFLCPGDENYAAVALQLQQTAQQAEACLYDLEHALRAAVNPPTVFVTTTATQTVLANNNSQIALAASSVTFSNVALSSTLFPQTPLGAGMWHIGASLNCVATGAVTVDSVRVLEIRSRKQTDFALGVSTNSVQSTQDEPNNGTGVDFSFSTIFPLTDTDVVQFRFLHSNASSVNISIGARFWMTRLSSQFNAKVVA